MKNVYTEKKQKWYNKWKHNYTFIHIFYKLDDVYNFLGYFNAFSSLIKSFKCKWLFFSFFKIFLNFILFLNFTILYWFCQISKWIRYRYSCVPNPEPSSLLPPHTIPLGRPSALAPSIQYHASNLDWHLVSYMIFYMFQCHSPKSSHPLPLP